MNYYEDGSVIERIKQSVTGKKLGRYGKYSMYSLLLALMLTLIDFIIFSVKGKFTAIFEEVTCIEYIVVILFFVGLFMYVKLYKISTFYNFDKVNIFESKEQISKRLKHNLYKYYLCYKIEDDYEISKDYIPHNDFYIRLSDGTIYKVEKTLLYEYKKEKPKDTVTVGSIAV